MITKQEIQTLGLQALHKYLVLDIEQVKDDKSLIHLLQKAKLGLQFEKEINLNKRATENNQIRIFKLTSNDKTELKKYLKKSFPTYF